MPHVTQDSTPVCRTASWYAIACSLQLPPALYAYAFSLRFPLDAPEFSMATHSFLQGTKTTELKAAQPVIIDRLKRMIKYFAAGNVKKAYCMIFLKNFMMGSPVVLFSILGGS
jgi:hypothetical protein